MAVHVLEHVYRWEAVPVLQEWLRLLKPGGQLILELPCMNKVFAYLQQLGQGHQQILAQMVHWALWGDPRYGDPSMVHRWGYSMEEVEQVLIEAGAQRITFAPVRYHRKDRDMRVIGYKGV